MQRRVLLSAGAVSTTLGGFAIGSAARVWTKPAALGSAIPDLPVIDHEGQRHRFYADLVQGRVVTLNFFFAGCGAICPLVTQNLLRVQELLAPRVGRDIFMYSLTLRPEEDTPELLGGYVAAHGIGPGWRFLTGALKDMEQLRRRLGFASADPALDRVADEHTGLLRYGSDALDRWAGCPGLSRPEWIAKAITTSVAADPVG